MADYDHMMIVQLGDVAVHQHLTQFERAKLSIKGKAQDLLFSNTILLPSNSGIEPRKLKIEGVIYADYGRSRSQMGNHLRSLINRPIDVIGAQFLHGQMDTHRSNGYIASVHDVVMWVRNSAIITDFELTNDEGVMEFEAKLMLAGHWQPLCPAEWQMIPRQEAQPSFFEKSSFEVDDINPLPSAGIFFQDEQPYSFHKRHYLDTGHHYDPTYFLALTAHHDDDLPLVRYASGWDDSPSRFHYVTVDKLRWSVDPVCLYLFKNLTGATTITVEITHDAGWSRVMDTTTIDVGAIFSAMTTAGYVLVDSDILVMGTVSGGAFVQRNGVILVYVADSITRTGGTIPGQVYRGDNIIKIRGATYAQHHIFRGF